MVIQLYVLHSHRPRQEPKAAAPAFEAKKTEEAPVEAKKEEVKL